MDGTLHKVHEDHIAEKGIKSLNHYKLMHKFIHMPQAMKIPDAKAAADKQSEKLQNIPAWQLSTKEVIQEAQKEQTTVHFA